MGSTGKSQCPGSVGDFYLVLPSNIFTSYGGLVFLNYHHLFKLSGLTIIVIIEGVSQNGLDRMNKVIRSERRLLSDRHCIVVG